MREVSDFAEDADRPNVIHKSEEDKLEVWFADGLGYVLTWEPCPELGEEFTWGIRVNGEFIYLENPFWIMDLLILPHSDEYDPAGLNVGGFLYWEGTE